MSITKRQVETVTERIILRYLKEGRPPSVGALRREMEAYFEAHNANMPLMRIRKQERRRRWDIAKQNTTLEEVDLDLEIAYAEIVELAKSLLRRHNFTEVAYLAQSRALDKITGELDSLLFVTENAEDRFFGIFDNFQDTSKMDNSLSTPGVIDLAEKALVLPSGAINTRKVPLPHLYEAEVWTVGVRSDTELVSNKTGLDAPFGNAFHDLLSVWRQDVVVKEQTPVTIEFTIPVSAVETQEVSITRIQVIPHSVHPMELGILTSTDDVNYTKIPEGSDLTLKQGDTTYNVDFEKRRVQWIRFQLTKTTPDEELQDGYRYSFGLKHIGLYTIGRALQAEMVSIPMSPAGMDDPISKVSLNVDQKLTAKCRVDWSIKGIDQHGEEVGDWRPVAPMNFRQSELPTIISFGNDVVESHKLTGASATVYSTWKNHSLYELATNVLPTGSTSIDPIFGSARLLRGINAWSRNREQEVEIKQTRDVYVSFNTGLRQQLYAVLTESAEPGLGGGLFGDTVTTMTVDNTIDYDSETMDPIPGLDVDVTADVTPTYSIYKITHVRAEQRVFTEDVSVFGKKFTYFDYPHVDTDPENITVILKSGSGQTFTAHDGSIKYEGDEIEVGKDVFVERDEATGKVWISFSANMNQLEYGQYDDTIGLQTQVTYSLDSDVTQLVSSIQGKRIYLKHDLKTDQGDRFEVTYRFVPKDAYKVIRSSARVTKNFGSDEGEVYQEGRDYYIDVKRGVITRVPQGRIRPDGDDVTVYVDFSYEAPATLLETFTIWGFVDSREPKTLSFSDLGVDSEAGEQVFLRTGPDSVELTKLTETPELGFGWHQIVVRSKDPDTNSNTAIHKVTVLQDSTSNPVFIAGGKYFSRLVATRIPMVQVDADYLLTNILPANHENFALTTSGEVLVNFDPGTTLDLYTYGIRLDSSGSVETGTWDEEFELEFRRRLENTIKVQGLRVRAALSRLPGADGSLTPKVYRYQARIG
jgi:hypothetical protein